MSHGRTGIILLTGIGDVVHGLPVANGLKRARPDTRLLWIAEPAPAQILRHHPAVDEVVVFRRSAGLSGVMDLRKDLRRRPCGTVLNLQRYVKSLWPLWFMSAPRRVGLPPSKTRDGIFFFHTEHLPEGPWQHTQDMFLDFLGHLDLPREPVEWKITLSGEERAAQADFFRALDRPDRPVVSVVLGTANRHKDWPAERYPGLVEALEREMGYTVLLVGGPGAREREAAARVVDEAEADPVVALGDSVRRLVWLVDGSSLVISPDTGPLHVAHALDVPVVGLFGHTNPARTGPWLRYRDLVVDRFTEPGQEPDPSVYEPREGRMGRITTEDILDKVERARSRYGADGPSPVLERTP